MREWFSPPPTHWLESLNWKLAREASALMAAMVADNFSVSTPFTVAFVDTFKSAAGFVATDGWHSITVVMMCLLDISRVATHRRRAIEAHDACDFRVIPKYSPPALNDRAAGLLARESRFAIVLARSPGSAALAP